MSFLGWLPRVVEQSCLICAVSARRVSCRPMRRDPANRRRSVEICSTLWMRSISQALLWPALTGADAAPAWRQRCGRSACVVWCWRTAIRSRTLPQQPGRGGRSRNIARGINSISTPSAVARALPPIGASSANCCGGCGLPTGSSMTRPMNAPPLHSTIRILSMLSSIRIATVMATRPATPTSRQSSSGWRRFLRLSHPPLRCPEAAMAFRHLLLRQVRLVSSRDRFSIGSFR